MENQSKGVANPKSSLEKLESTISDIAVKASADIVRQFFNIEYKKVEKKTIVPCRVCRRDMGIRRKYRNGQICGMGCFYTEIYRKMDRDGKW